MMVLSVFSVFSDDGTDRFKEREPLPEQKLIQTPYGCRLQYTLPHGNTLTVHLKDKKLIRNKKRWSQVSGFPLHY